MNNIRVFISSKMIELKPERELIQEFLPSLNQGIMNIKPWIFENDAPASNESIREVYLEALQNSALYIGIFWKDYGEYTIDEFERAGEWNIPRHIYVKDVEANRRDPKLQVFLEKYGDVETGITAAWFTTEDELRYKLQLSIEEWLKNSIMYRLGSSQAILYDDPNDVDYMAETGLFGRDDIEKEIELALMDDNSRVLLQAFGGVGKTALAAHISSEWIERTEEKVLWLRMGASDSNAVFEALAHPFNSSQKMASTPIENKPKALRNLVKNHNVGLVVLDDVWNGESLVAIQKGIPRNVPLLITARQRYPLKTIISVPDLPEEEALALLKKLAPSLVQDITSARNLCKKLSYHAFAIEIAGRTMQAKSYTAKKLLATIEATDITQMEIPLEYHQSGYRNIATLVEATLNELPEDAKRVFFGWGAFWSTNTTSALMEMYFTENIPVSESLSQIHLFGLCYFENSSYESSEFYRLHNLAFAYSKTRSTDNQVKQAYLTCINYMQLHSESNLKNFTYLYPVIDNLMEAIEFALKIRDFQTVQDSLAVLIANINGNGLLISFALYNKALVLLGMVSNVATQKSDKFLIAYTKMVRGMISGAQGNFEDALKHLNQAASIYKQLNMIPNFFLCQIIIGNTYNGIGMYKESENVLKHSLSFAKSHNYLQLKQKVLLALANNYNGRGLYNKALDFARQSKNVASKINDKQAVAHSIATMGNMYTQMQNYEKAEEFLREAMEIHKNLGDKHSLCNDIGNLGNAVMMQQRYEEAMQLQLQDLEIREEIKDIRGKGITLGNIGDVLFFQGKYEEAITYHSQGLEISEKFSNIQSIAKLNHNLAKDYIGLIKTNIQTGSTNENYRQNCRIFAEHHLYKARKAFKSINNLEAVNNLDEFIQVINNIPR